MDMATVAEQALAEIVSSEEKLSEKTKMLLIKAARILVEAGFIDEKHIIEAYFLLVKMQRKGELEYPVDYEFTRKALKLASILANKLSSKGFSEEK